MVKNDKKKSEDKLPSIIRVPDFAKYYATGVFGNVTATDFRYEFLNEKIYSVEDDEWSYISDMMIMLTPRAAKKLLNLLQRDIDIHEREHGIIEITNSIGDVNE